MATPMVGAFAVVNGSCGANITVGFSGNQSVTLLISGNTVTRILFNSTSANVAFKLDDSVGFRVSCSWMALVQLHAFTDEPD